MYCTKCGKVISEGEYCDACNPDKSTPKTQKRKMSKKAKIAVIVSICVIVAVAVTLILVFTLGDDSSHYYGSYSYSSNDHSDIYDNSGTSQLQELLLMYNWMEDRKYYATYLDFGYSVVAWKIVSSDTGKLETVSNHKKTYLVVSEDTIAVVDDDYSTAYYYITFNSDKTIMYMTETGDGLDHTTKTLYAVSED